jgi:hypothetical protein
MIAQVDILKRLFSCPHVRPDIFLHMNNKLTSFAVGVESPTYIGWDSPKVSSPTGESNSYVISGNTLRTYIQVVSSCGKGMHLKNILPMNVLSMFSWFEVWHRDRQSSFDLSTFLLHFEDIFCQALYIRRLTYLARFGEDCLVSNLQLCRQK